MDGWMDSLYCFTFLDQELIPYRCWSCSSSWCCWPVGATVFKKA